MSCFLALWARSEGCLLFPQIKICGSPINEAVSCTLPCAKLLHFLNYARNQIYFSQDITFFNKNKDKRKGRLTACPTDMHTNKEALRFLSRLLKMAATRSVLPSIGRSGFRLEGHASLLIHKEFSAASLCRLFLCPCRNHNRRSLLPCTSLP